MYTCPNCGQEMIDKKEFCIKCGHRFKEEKKQISFKMVAIIFMVFILLGVLVCYLIMNAGTDEELNEYLPNNDSSIESRIDSIDEEDVDTTEKEMILFPED